MLLPTAKVIPMCGLKQSQSNSLGRINDNYPRKNFGAISSTFYERGDNHPKILEVLLIRSPFAHPQTFHLELHGSPKSVTDFHLTFTVCIQWIIIVL